MEREQVIFSVSELNEYVNILLANDPNLAQISVRGEISGFKRHTSGHLYFMLKDANATVRCVMFKSYAWTLAFRPAEGQKVVVTGSASLYTRDGSFQLYVTSMQQLGDGELYREYIELKERLEQEGYFDPRHKRPIPFLPRKVGVVTSGSGAAIQDITNVIRRRFPTMNIELCPVRVQGDGAAAEIAAGIRRMNQASDCDVLIVGRGGGSIEDLWCFNDTEVAKAVYESRIPVISAVGHETDFTIIDFVADLRAPTPSAAAELAVPCLEELKYALEDYKTRLSGAPQKDCRAKRERIALLMRSAAFRGPENRVANEYRRLDEVMNRMQSAERAGFAELKARLEKYRAMLGALSPDAVLERGFAIVRKKDGTLAKASGLAVGDAIEVRFADGAAEAAVTKSSVS